MIVDVRFRPAYKSLAKMEVYQRRPEETFAVNIGMTPSGAAVQQSMDLFLQEMDASGIVHGVCHGRARDGSHNDALVALLRQYPGRFTGFANIPLTDMSQAIEAARRCLDDLGLPGLMLEPVTCVPPYPDDVRLYPSMNCAGSAALKSSLPSPHHNDWPRHALSATSQAGPGGFPRNCRT